MGERLRWGSWDYAERGPARWAGLSEEYAACERGHEQSPLALVTPDVGGTPEALELHYGEVRVDLTDNGHTVLVPTAGGSYAVVGGERYFLFQIHFHAPSEHTIDGREHPMEIHLVHRTRAQQLFVLGVPVASGAPNAALAALFAHLPERGHLTADLRFDPRALLPTDRAALRYRGSLTTPPCSEPVEWAVLTSPITVSEAQLAAFRAIHDGNRRPPRPAFARRVRPARVLDARW